MAKLRLFVAAPVAPALEAGVGEILSKMAKHRSVRWVSKAQLHITLRFIGDFEESLVSKLAEGLKETALSLESFEAEVGGLGAFPRLERPRVLFLPVLKGAEDFGKLERKLSARLEDFGVKLDGKDYHPHLTLGRARENANPAEAVEALQKGFPAGWEPWKVDRFILFQSQLAPGGAVYTGLMEFEFGKR